MSATAAPVLSEVRNRIGHLILNRPEGLNALTLPMVQLLQQQLQQWASDPAIKAVVLRANGEKAFCAGGDIRALHDSFKNGDTLHEQFFVEEYALDQYIHTYPKPLLALMDGFVLGGGMGLVQGADVRVISERTRMGMPEVGIGYFPDVGGSYFLPRLQGELGTWMAVTGNQVRAADALYAGLADYCIEQEQLPAVLTRLDAITWGSTNALDNLHAAVQAFASKKLPGAELKAMQVAIDQHFAHDRVADILASLSAEQRPEFQDWAEETMRTLHSRSPLAMAVTLELMRRGRNLALADCFALELHLDRQWFTDGDIVEGVRALLIDKDKQPQWNPPRIDQLDDARVAAFFNGFSPVAG